MAAGLPVVGTRVGGIPELVRDGQDGLLVAPRDPAALAEAMLKLLLQPELAERMGRAARERIRTTFSIEKMVSETEGVYTSLLREAESDRRGEPG
jgi:glycosyltransferase involved in cell wall biosynthesis